MYITVTVEPLIYNEVLGHSWFELFFDSRNSKIYGNIKKDLDIS